MIVYNNQAPNKVNNVGQFGATEGSIGAYKQAAEYAADAKYWALLSQTKYSSVEEILAEVERLYTQGLLLEEDIKQLKSDFETQQQELLGLIQSTNTAIDNTNAATELSKEATQDVLAQLDIISNMTVQTTLLPPGSMATGSYDNSTGVFSFGIPEGQPGRDGTDGTISDIGDVAVGVPVSDDYGFYVDKENGGLYRANMSDIANLIPSIRSISINGGEEQTGAVSFNSVSSFNSRTGDVVSEVGDYSVEQITGAAKSGANSDITSLSGLTTALSVSQGGTGATTAEESRTNLGLGSVSVEDIVPLTKGGTGATTAGAARTSLGLGLVSTESIVPITKGGTGSTSAENARLALVAAKSGVNSDITSMTNGVTFTQPVSVADAVDATNAVNLGQISSSGVGKGAALIHDNTRNSSVQSVLDASAAGYSINDAALSTANLAGKTLYRIFKPLSVADTDNQGAITPAGMTVSNHQRNQNAISTAKTQSAFRIGGDDVTISGVKGVGLAEPDNSATSEFITTRMAWSASQVISNLRIENVNVRKFTAGVGLYEVNGAQVLNSNFRDMQYSSSSLNSAGGYGVVIENGKNIEVSGNTFVATASDRHAVYVSVTQGYTPPATGWENVRIVNNYYDWSGTESANDDSKVTFNVRAGNGLFISGNRGIGGTRCVGLHNSDGPINNVVISNNYVTGIKPQAGLSGCFISSLSASANGYQINNLDIVNNTFQVLRDPTTAGLDQAARLIKVNNLRIVNNKHTIDTGVGYLIQDCNNVFIDDIVEVVTDPAAANTIGARTLDFEGSCSNITIGNIRTNRLTRSDGKTNLIYGLPNCTDVTCNFSRYIEFTVTNGVVSQVDDAYEIIPSGGVTFGASSITIAFRDHVTQAATASCAPYTRTANNTILTKAIIGTKSITIALTNANTGAAQPTASYTARIGVNFFS